MAAALTPAFLIALVPKPLQRGSAVGAVQRAAVPMAAFQLPVLEGLPKLDSLPKFLALNSLPKLDELLQSGKGGARADSLVRNLFANAGEAAVVDAAAVAAACSETVKWVDMGLPEPLIGPTAVKEHLGQLWPDGSKLVIERIADGARSGGFCWHREAEGVEGIGLRGITYLELDASGQIARVQEGYEPLFKLDTLLEALLQAANANKKPNEAKLPASYERASPRTAEGIVRYLWVIDPAHPQCRLPTDVLTWTFLPLGADFAHNMCACACACACACVCTRRTKPTTVTTTPSAAGGCLPWWRHA